MRYFVPIVKKECDGLFYPLSRLVLSEPKIIYFVIRYSSLQTVRNSEKTFSEHYNFHCLESEIGHYVTNREGEGKGEEEEEGEGEGGRGRGKGNQIFLISEDQRRNGPS